MSPHESTYFYTKNSDPFLIYFKQMVSFQHINSPYYG